MAKKQTLGRYANILLDYWFKRTFGEEREQLMRLFLQELIPERKIVKLKYEPQEHVNPWPEHKDIRVDVECTDADGTRFVVEMQLAEQDFFYERAVFNSSFAIQEQMPKGADEYDFPTVYFIGLTDFSIHEGSDRVMYRYSLREDRPAGLDEEIFWLLFESAEIANFTPSERIKYEEDMTTEHDIRNQIRFAEKKGMEKGMEKGLEKVARQMLADSVPAETVVRYTGLSKEALAALE